MKQIINLTKNPEDVLKTIVDLYSSNTDTLPLYRGEEEYTVKYAFSEGTAVIGVEVLPNFYRFHVSTESSILMLKKPDIPTFTVDMSTQHNGSIKYHSMPYEKDAREWLRREFIDKSQGVVTRGEYLITIATVCQMIWCHFLFAFDKKVSGDTVEFFPHKNFETFVREGTKFLVAEQRKAHRLDGWDVVTLTDKQLRKLGETLEEHHIQHDFNNVSIPKFCLDLYDTKGKYHQYYFMEYHTSSIHFEIEDDRSTPKAYCDVHIKRRPDGQLELELDDNTNAMAWLTMLGKNEEGAEQVTHWQWMMDVFFSINSFMLHFGDVTMDVETKVAQQQTGNREQRRKNRTNTVRMFKTYKLIKNWKSQARKKAEITCPAWGVRGHFRHLRNGKTIFVEAYIKGKEKDKYKGKEYALLPYKDA